MALSRRTGSRFQASIWPGFVDAMTGLLLVLMFVLTIFMVIQFVLRETITGQENELTELSEEVAALASALGLERDTTRSLRGELSSLSSDLDDAEAQARAQANLIATLTTQTENQAEALAAADARITSFEAQVATLLAQRDDGLAQIAALEGEQADLLSQQEALNLALATARNEIDDQAEAARLAAARREALEALMADLEASKAATEASLAQTLAQLQSEQEAGLSLSQSLASLRDTLDETEAARRALQDANGQLQQDNATLQADNGALQSQLSAEERTRLAEAAAAEALRQQLASTQDTLSAEEQARLAELAAAEALRQRLAATQEALSAEEAARLADAAAAQALRDRLAQSEDELTAMSLALEAQRKEAEDTLTLLAASRAALDAAEVNEANLTAKLAAALVAGDNAKADIEALQAALDEAARARAAEGQTTSELQDQLAAALAEKLAAESDIRRQLSEIERRDALLAAANVELSAEEAKSADSQRRLTVLNEQVAALRQQLSQLQGLLDDASEREADREVQVEFLGAELNGALARAAQEERRRRELEEAERKRLEDEAEQLAAYRSEFFGEVRKLLEGQDGVRIVGDRFVFSSEVLFAPGRAELSSEGQLQISKIAGILRGVTGQIPDDIDWVLQIDGHTDNLPLSGTGQYRNNWELSQGRALSVVLYMVNFLGLPPGRLSANGFGQYQPINPLDTPEARAQNRRIEMKFTEK